MPEASSPLNPIEVQFKEVSNYHIFFLCIFFITKFMSTWHTLNMIFLSPNMVYTCGDDKTENACPCDNPIWDYSMFTETVQTKFDIICEKRHLISTSETLAYFGMLVGALTFGVFSDRFGRLMCYSLCHLLIGLAGCVVSVMPTMALFMVARFFEGLGAGGAIVTGFVLCVEFCGSNYRATVASLLHFPTNCGLIALAGLSYMIRDCDDFQRTISIPVLVYTFMKLFLIESPKWLLEKNKKEEAILAMERFCRFNKTPCETIRQDIEAYITSRPAIGDQQLKFYHIFKYKRHAIRFVCMLYLYFICGMSYYGISQFIGKMSNQVHLNTVFNGLSLLVPTTISIFLINRVGRRPYLLVTIFLAGLCMIIVVILPIKFKPSWVRLMFACFSSAFYYSAFNIVFLYGVELFPTNIRSSVLGVLSLSSRCGQLLGPTINSFSPIFAGSFYGTLAIVGGFISFFLPETRGVELPSTLEENPAPPVTLINQVKK